jgi:uncharacterized protein (DUF2147 family)
LPSLILNAAEERKRGLMRMSLISSLALYLFVSMPLPSGPTTSATTAELSSNTFTPVGKWRTVDDRTGKVKAVVAIWEEDGKLYGKIEKLIDPVPNIENPRCIYCLGELKDKPIVGLRILWDLRKDGDLWSGGRILDPENGKTYRCFIAVQESGKILKVRGFIGFSLLGRTQYWLRDQ